MNNKEQLEVIKASCKDYFKDLILAEVVEDSINLLGLYKYPIDEIQDIVKRLGEIAVYHKATRKVAPMFESVTIYCNAYQIYLTWETIQLDLLAKEKIEVRQTETILPTILLNKFIDFGMPVYNQFIELKEANTEITEPSLTFTNLTKVIEFMTSESGRCFGIIKALK